MPPLAYPAAPPVLGNGRRRLAWWQRFLLWCGFGLLGFVVLLGSLAAFGYWSFSTGRINRWFLMLGSREAAKTSPQERPWPPAGQEPPDTWPGPRPDAGQAGRPADLFVPTKVWETHLRFTKKQWKGAEPEAVSPAGGLMQANGKIRLRNSNASRNGLLGAFGLDLPWSACSVDFGGLHFTNVATRFKGNGTFLGSFHSYKRPFKLDFNRAAPGRMLAGVEMLNLHNLNADFSGVSDTMAYEFFRAAGVPAPRTGFARMLLTVEGEFNRRPLGLYLMVENPDNRWAKETFGKKGVALFKPVTYDLFKDLGGDWSAYQGIYDPKTKLTPLQERRVIDAARLVSSASDADFARQVGEFFDLTEVARFVAVHALLSCYDGFLNNGQNFLMYLEPGSNRFGFIPWDMDRAWGEFGFVGTQAELETASVVKPWVDSNRFLERLFAAEPFRLVYRAELERVFNALFDPDRLCRRLDELAAVIRPTVEEESDYRRSRFAEAVAAEWSKEPRANNPSDPARPVHQIKRFVTKRAESVREQLAGRSTGHAFPVRSMP